MTKSAAHDVEEIQSGICILHGVGGFAAILLLSRFVNGLDAPALYTYIFKSFINPTFSLKIPSISFDFKRSHSKPLS
ncbi:hypothetical protein VB713_26915 [Anabaena cylindrica UHCC 0172]|uniref:hypothetical protein n=1 Tax=Anabaena cylindrica TaxID=1165 RepID=UPI002B20FEE2|nr:hypothetical protein [Anabaena cylindrica]MEA5554565.1 hypothetical protein [Anabaena cylindrica UHCC 0172]